MAEQGGPALFDRLKAEMPGILNWALDGLTRLQAKGRITEPTCSREAVTTMQDTASPTSAFIRERCLTGPTCSVPVDTLWAVWREWAEDNDVKAVGTKQIIGRNLLSPAPPHPAPRRLRPASRHLQRHHPQAVRSTSA
ncbi:hypothetical protein [Streptomyces sp. NPDC002763]|uniref:hypothetical protein n=1 Tax=Streptomyces sp. NPDC002763 TaxID=3154427 RepID=UPI00332C831F